MSARRVCVTTSRRASGEIAEVFTTAAAGWLRLDELGIVEQVRQRLRLERKDGCCGQELFGLLFLLFMSGLAGQRALQRAAAHCKKALSDVLGARTFRSQASMSRALRSVHSQQSREFCDWLLGGALPVGELERDSSAWHFDTFGERWRMVDFDGRVHTIRKRALPESPEHPEASRRSSELAKPGYSGRKRGEVQYHQMVVQDAGTGRYLGVRLGPGNGDHRTDVQWAVERIAEWADALDAPPRRVCARFDGKAAGAPALLDCERAGICFLTRWTAYDLLEEPEVRKVLEQGPWQVVEDSGSGPRREATALGVRRFGLYPHDRQAHDELRHLDARLVVSRYRQENGRGRGSGKQMGELVYELYITTLPAPCWPAAELVELYYGRVVEENRFGQTDCEQGRQRVVSWHLPGQQLALAISLFTWNLRLRWGADLVGWKPTPQPRQGLRRPRFVEPEARPRAEPCPPPASSSGEQRPRVKDQVLKDEKPYRRYITRGAISEEVMAALDWPRLLEGRPGWRWNADDQELSCPAGEPMHWQGTRQEASHSIALIFRVRRRAACQICSLKAGCTSSTAHSYRKDVWITIAASELPGLPAQHPPNKFPPQRSFFLPASKKSDQAGSRAARAPTLVPSVLRKQPMLALTGCRLTATSPPAPLTTRAPSWSALTAEQRQHRRQSYLAREARCLLPPDHQLDINIHFPGPPRTSVLAKLLPRPRPDRNHRRTK